MEAKKAAAWADALYVLMAPHNVGGPISTAAALHLAACTTNFKVQEHFNDFDAPHIKLTLTLVTDRVKTRRSDRRNPTEVIARRPAFVG